MLSPWEIGCVIEYGGCKPHALFRVERTRGCGEFVEKSWRSHGEVMERRRGKSHVKSHV